MTASKEMCEEASIAFEKIENGKGTETDRKKIRDFFEAAKRRLPSHAAIAKDRKRTRTKAK